MKRCGVAIVLCALAVILYAFGSAWAVTYAYIPSHGNDSVVRVDTAAGTFDSVTFDGGSCSPYGAAVASDGSFVMITCSDQDAVTALSNAAFEDDTIPETTDVGNDPRGVAVDPEGNYAYVANFGDDKVSVINVDSVTVIDTLDVGDGPFGVAAIHQESESRIKVYVSNYNDGTLSVIVHDGSEFEVTTIDSVGTNPVGVAATPDGQFVFVANYNQGLIGNVTVIRTADDTIDRTVQAGRGPWGVAIGAKGGYAFVTNSDSGANSVTLIRTSDFNRMTNTVGVMPHGVAAPKNGDFAYVINQEGAVPISEADTSLVITPIDQNATHPIESPFALGAFIGGTPPAVPGDLTVASDDGDVTLTWTDNSDDELGFKIERREVEDSDDNSTDDETAFEEIGEADENATEFTDDTVNSGTSYQYRIRAFNEAADSDYEVGSEQVSPSSDSFSWCFIGTLSH